MPTKAFESVVVR